MHIYFWGGIFLGHNFDLVKYMDKALYVECMDKDEDSFYLKNDEGYFSFVNVRDRYWNGESENRNNLFEFKKNSSKVIFIKDKDYLTFETPKLEKYRFKILNKQLDIVEYDYDDTDLNSKVSFIQTNSYNDFCTNSSSITLNGCNQLKLNLSEEIEELTSELEESKLTINTLRSELNLKCENAKNDYDLINNLRCKNKKLLEQMNSLTKNFDVLKCEFCALNETNSDAIKEKEILNSNYEELKIKYDCAKSNLRDEKLKHSEEIKNYKGTIYILKKTLSECESKFGEYELELNQFKNRNSILEFEICKLTHLLCNIQNKSSNSQKASEHNLKNMSGELVDSLTSSKEPCNSDILNTKSNTSSNKFGKSKKSSKLKSKSEKTELSSLNLNDLEELNSVLTPCEKKDINFSDIYTQAFYDTYSK